jgi:hypothetical protein
MTPKKVAGTGSDSGSAPSAAPQAATVRAQATAASVAAPRDPPALTWGYEPPVKSVKASYEAFSVPFCFSSPEP